MTEGSKMLGIDQMKDPEMREKYKELLSIAWPASLEGALMSLMNALDTMMVGRLGPAAIAAVGLCGQPRMLMLVMTQALCVGTTAFIARRFGEKRQDRAVSCVKQSLAIVTVLGILMSLIGITGSRFLVNLAGANDETRELAALYFRIIAAAFIANNWALCICAAMRGIGETKITLRVNMASNIVNVILNYCLIEGHFGFPALGVLGAAIATAIGSCVSCLMAIHMLFKKGYLCPLGTGMVKFDKETVSSLAKVGGGSIFESVFMRIGFMMNTRLIAGLGTIALATNQVVMQCTSFSFTLGEGVSSAGTALVGKSLGERDKKKASDYIEVVTHVSTWLSILLIAFFFSLRHVLPTLFSDDPDVIRGSAIAFIVVLFGIYSQNKRTVLSGCLRGAGDVRYIAIVSLISVAIARPLMTWLFCYPINQAFPMLALSFCGQWVSFDLESVLRSRLMQWRVKNGGWADIKV